MTVRVTTLKGCDAGAYYVEQLPNYYLQSGEPRGTWLGDGASMLGLSGEVDDDAFLALIAGMDPQRPDRHLGRRYNDDSVRGFDVTASAPKSVSVLFALGDDDVRREVLDAHDAAVAALAGWIECHAHTRYRIGGEVAVVDAEGIVAAMFRQHTSRALDPQLHTHLVIANRVKSPDGRWLALDARLIKGDQRTLSALYHAGLRSELTQRLSVAWHMPENGIAEIRDVPEALLVEFSIRTAQMRRRVEEKLDRFVDTMGREPTPQERWLIDREAAVDSRSRKAKSVDAASLHDGWREQARALGMEPSRVIEDAVEQLVYRGSIDHDLDDAITDWSIQSISEQQSSWRPTELVREVASWCPTETAEDADTVVRWADELAGRVAAERCVDISKPIPPGALLRRDGRPVTESVIDRALTTQAILDQERSLIEWADRRFEHDGPDDPAAADRSAVDMTLPQADAASAVAGHADLVLIVGPAGTGKTTALRPAVEHLRANGRAVFGVAPSATGAEVLSEETGVAADTIHKLLIEHTLNRPPDHRYDLPVGATVIVDEAGMLPTEKLAEIANLADTRGWRLALVGDPLQFSAVGRGGMFALMVDTFGAIELDQVHRFANEWEREASLRLRRGDVTVAEIYDAHDRLHAGTIPEMERAAARLWHELRQAGKRELLMTPTNEATERLNERCQRLRIRAGEIDADGRSVDVGAYRLYVGDEIATRQNERRLLTDRDDMVRNRAVWTIEAIHRDGSLTATGKSGVVHLPAEYVNEHVELAYARTGMGGQGRNVLGGLLFADRLTDIRNLYVAMSRGSEMNHAFFGVTGEETAVDVFVQCMTTDWIDQPATVRHAELNQTTPHRPGLLDGPVLRALMEQRHEILTSLYDAESIVDAFHPHRHVLEADIAEARTTRARAEAACRAAENVIETHDRPLRRRKHEHEIRSAQRELQRQPEVIRRADATIAAAEGKLTDLAQRTSEAKEFLRRRPELESRVTEIDERLAHDRRVRTRIARLEQPSAIIDTLGPRPRGAKKAQAWDKAAGRVHQHQAAFDIQDGIGDWPGRYDRSAYGVSYEAVEDSIWKLRPQRPTIEVARPEIGLSGIEM
jgi:conjugative relaxase-like TrwC/TraI family protein